MAQEHGFRFEIRGEVFIPQKSKAGADVVDAYSEAVTARKHIQEALSEIPATFTIGDPVAVSRRVRDGDEP